MNDIEFMRKLQQLEAENIALGIAVSYMAQQLTPDQRNELRIRQDSVAEYALSKSMTDAQIESCIQAGLKINPAL